MPTKSCNDRTCRDPDETESAKTWRSFDGPAIGSPKRSYSKLPRKTSEPMIARRVQSIVVPRESQELLVAGLEGRLAGRRNRSGSSSPGGRSRSGSHKRSRSRSGRRRSSRGEPPPSGRSKLKWALVALAGAALIGIAIKTYIDSQA